MKLVVVSSRSDKFSFRSCEIPVRVSLTYKIALYKGKTSDFQFFFNVMWLLMWRALFKISLWKKRTNSGYLVLDIHSRTIWLVNDFVRMTRLRNSLGGLQCRLYIVDSTLYSTDSTVHRLQLTMMLMATVCLLNIRIIISMHSDNI